MTVTYKDLIDTVIKREFGILGRDRMMAVLKDLKMEVDAAGTLKSNGATIGDLERLLQLLSEKYGAVAVMGCKIAVGRMARESNLELPPILK